MKVTEMAEHQQRKADHIRINLEEDVAFPHLTTGLENYRFIHNALPETDLHSIDMSTQFLGKGLRLPILVSSMTGGTGQAETINQRLAEAAQHRGLAMGLGSQRTALESPDTADSFRVRDAAPDIFLLANLGAVQLNYGYTVDHCRRAVDMVQADGLILHFNPLQEALQSDGNWNWSGLLGKIEGICNSLPVPVIAKEVGWGISEPVARQLAGAGVAAIDVAGAGGTSWSEVESHRAPTEARRRLCRAFADWGIPTAESLQAARRSTPGLPLIASGGLRTGIEVAKCLALGAEVAGIASPLLKAATESTEAVVEAIDTLADELRIALFCTGARRISDLRQPGLLTPVHGFSA